MSSHSNTIMGFFAAALFCMMMAASAWAGDKGTVVMGSLVWLKDANCFGKDNWHAQNNRIHQLSNGFCGLKDGSVQNDWRMPTVQELQGLQQSGMLSKFHSVKEYYWSSTLATDTSRAYIAAMNRLYGAAYPKTKDFYVLPVRAKKSSD